MTNNSKCRAKEKPKLIFHQMRCKLLPPQFEYINKHYITVWTSALITKSNTITASVID